MVLAARNITKVYTGVVANEDVSLDVRRGEILALLGENGAGKSTIAHILSGSLRPDLGHVEIDGNPVQFRSPRDAFHFGVGLVAQHFELANALTVAENVLLADSTQPWFLSKRKACKTVAQIGERYGIFIDPSATVEDLSLGEKQQLEILRALHRGTQVLLMDEPTSILTPQQSDNLLSSLRQMALQGMSVIFISHKLTEVMSIADRITVMRDGRVVDTLMPIETSPDHLAETMVGRKVDLSTKKDRPSVGAIRLSVTGLSASGPDSRTRLSNVNLHVSSGEIVGIAGVSGNGQNLLADAISGLSKINGGAITVCQQLTTNAGVRATRAAGLRYVPADRLGTGLVPGLTIAENMLLTQARPLFFGRRHAKRKTLELVDRFDVRSTGINSLVKSLSGGNAQKVLLGRELGDHSEVMVVVSPTWGLDVGAVEFVRKLLHKKRSEGGAILLISEDLDELCALADRVYVIFNGLIESEFGGPDFNLLAIGLAMAGVNAPSNAVTHEESMYENPS